MDVSKIGCPASYSCHVDLVLLDSNTEIQSSNILRSNIRTYFEEHDVFRYHFLYSKIRRLEDGTSHVYTVTGKCFCFMIELIH